MTIMQKVNHKKSKFFLRIICFFALTVVAIFCLAATIQARYVNSNSASFKDLDVPDYVFCVNDTTSLDISQLTRPGTSQSYTFTVTNKDSNGNISELAQDYTITVKDFGNLPFTYSLTAGGTEIENESEAEGVFMASDSFVNGQEGSKVYTLTISWAASDNDFKYADMVELVTLSVNSNQTVLGGNT